MFLFLKIICIIRLHIAYDKYKRVLNLKSGQVGKTTTVIGSPDNWT